MSRLDGEKLDQYLPDGPITSLRGVETLYGALAEAASGGAVGGDPEFDLYYTPGELDEFVTDDPTEDNRYLITLAIDLTKADPGPVDVDIEIEPLTRDLVPELGYSWYWPGRAIDHSITHRGSKSGSTVNTVTTYCIERLERWTDADGREPAIGDVAEEHPDGWVIKSLQALAREDIEEHIRKLLEKRYTSEGKVVSTVKLRLDPDDLDKAPAGGKVGWFYPGHVHVLNEAMRARKDEKLAEKQDTESRGTSACMVTGMEGAVFGTADDPLNFFTVQHAEKFDELKRLNAWRSHPVSSDAALLLQSGASLLETCRTTRNGLGVYTLPYFVNVNDQRAEALCHSIARLQDHNSSELNYHPILELLEGVEEVGTKEDVDALRFYVISLRNDSGDINVIHEVPDVSIYWPRQVAVAHEAVIKDGTSFGLNAGFELTDNWEPITYHTDTVHALNSIVSGRYAWGTMPRMAGDDGAMADDLAEWLTYQLLTGRSIPVDKLLDGYVDRIAQERREDDENRFPVNHIKTQFAQLEAIARAGLLETADDTDLSTRPTAMDDHDLPSREEVAGDGNLSRLNARKYRLDKFLSDRDSLRENPDRKGAFLTGVLVGMVSHHQSSNRNMNRTVVDQYPADQITADRLVNVWPDLVQRCRVYAAEVGWAGESLFPELLDHQTDVLQYPDEWTIPLREVRFFYALGVAYGQRADDRASELVATIEAAENSIDDRVETEELA